MSVYIWGVLIAGTAFYAAIVYLAFGEWKELHKPEERDVLPEVGGLKTKRLPTVIFEPYKNLTGVVCTVCLKGYKSKHPIKVTPVCFHTIHAHCASEWFRLNTTCPACKAPAGDE